jgi:hypothetical protein
MSQRFVVEAPSLLKPPGGAAASLPPVLPFNNDVPDLNKQIYGTIEAWQPADWLLGK